MHEYSNWSMHSDLHNGLTGSQFFTKLIYTNWNYKADKSFCALGRSLSDLPDSPHFLNIENDRNVEVWTDNTKSRNSYNALNKCSNLKQNKHVVNILWWKPAPSAWEITANHRWQYLGFTFHCPALWTSLWFSYIYKVAGILDEKIGYLNKDIVFFSLRSTVTPSLEWTLSPLISN